MGQADGCLLVVVAHPDDESFGCGSLLGYAASLGLRTVVCCATRGESGTDERGLASAGALGQVREQELRAAAALLGVSEVYVFDWLDSAMTGEPAAGSLVAAPLDSVATAVVEVIEKTKPSVLVTLDGSDGHRDHGHIRDATLAAVDRSEWQVDRVYLNCLPRSLMARWVELLTAANPGSSYLELGKLGTPDEEISTVVDTTALLDLRWRAIRAHASQTSPFEALPPALQEAFLATDRLRRVRPEWRPGDPIEDEFC